MIRRRFLQLVTMAGAAGAIPLEAVAAGATNTVTYQVIGFSCITCATGLDTMLGREKGIVSGKSTYPEGKVTAVYNPGQTTPAAIAAFIAELGFTVASEHQAGSGRRG
jgi:copper chaperone CopZ